METSEKVGYISNVTLGNVQNCYDYWHRDWQPIPTPINYSFCTHTVEDKGTKALTIIKSMIEKKLIKLTTIEQFIDAMDLLVKLL